MYISDLCLIPCHVASKFINGSTYQVLHTCFSSCSLCCLLFSTPFLLFAFSIPWCWLHIHLQCQQSVKMMEWLKVVQRGMTKSWICYRNVLLPSVGQDFPVVQCLSHGPAVAVGAQWSSLWPWAGQGGLWQAQAAVTAAGDCPCCASRVTREVWKLFGTWGGLALGSIHGCSERNGWWSN